MIRSRKRSFYAVALIAGLICAAPQACFAQAPAAGTTSEKRLKAEQLDQLLAPIALYPDALLAQVLMASTYPLEIVQAARWAKSNPGKKGKALEDAMQGQTWDASVKSLVAVPQTLQLLDQQLDWAQKLGDAFLAQKADVMASVQRLRAKAVAAGKLQTTKEQKVTTQTAATKTVIVIEPVNPQVVYVPVYNPTVVYGVWAYPAYPPYYYYPPGYVAGTALVFTAGVAVGAALWGNCNWVNNDININVNQYNSYNRTNISNNDWKHDPSHRKGVPYTDSGVARQFGQGQPRNTAAHENFRGRPQNSSANNRDTQTANRAGETARPDRAGDRAGNNGNRAARDLPGERPDMGNFGDNAFANVDRGGAAARADASRGFGSFDGGGSRQGASSFGGDGPRGGGGGRGGGGRGRR